MYKKIVEARNMRVYLQGCNCPTFISGSNSKGIPGTYEFWTDIKKTWKLWIPTGDARTGTLETGKDCNHLAKGNIA